MAFQYMSWAVGKKVGSATGKAILMALANYADHEGRCFPSQKRLAEDCECGEKTVWRWLQKFEEMGLIARTHRQRDDGSRTSDELTLNPKNQTVSMTSREEIQTVTVSDPNRHSDGAYTITEPITSKTKQKILKERDQYGIEDQPIFSQFLTEIWPHRWKDGDDRKPAYFAYCKLTQSERNACAQVIGQAKRQMQQRENTYRKSMAAWLNANGWESFKPQLANQSNSNEWAKRMEYYERSGDWPFAWGAKPGMPGCKVPNEFLQSPPVKGAAA